MLDLLQDSTDDLWISTADGVLHTDLATGYQKWFNHKEGDSTTLPRDFIASIFLDSKKNLWLFPWREGIWQMDKETGVCKKMLDGFITESGKPKKLLISDAIEDTDGNIWMTDLDEGIILYEAKSGQFSKPFEKEIGTRTHTSRIILLNGMLYSALNNGVLKWDPRTKKLQIFQPPSELNKTITDIYPDKKGNWWLTTASGLIVFNETENTFRKFTSADGLYKDDIEGDLFCTTDGEMIIGTPDYFSFF